MLISATGQDALTHQKDVFNRSTARPHRPLIGPVAVAQNGCHSVLQEAPIRAM